ncbi:Clavaminate synthase-like protein [Mytilinidion resinicola]|uniref:Clavaminate synthase-like protein n=1 Tax=Mytilinidion resinicola TaxID=574789 RepID=A0A6A6Y542_9PEZI|nr:Clavaminate synthase-like protein [Mytilinidion resinicola]KAF2803144.1 Clavaminate synthase-like protein [Mytilinidion resinicola]
MTMQEGAIDAAKRFFSMPSEEKYVLNIKNQVGFQGYEPFCTQSYSPDNLPDMKESFFVGQDIPLDDSRVEEQRLLTGPIVWPSSLPACSFKEPVEEYYDALRGLTLRILMMIARGLPYGDDVFSEFISNNPAAPMRLLYYPPQEPNCDKWQLGASAHTDFGAITLLLQDDNEGLQVYNAQTYSWSTVPPRKDAFVVNVGDMLEK